MSRKKNPHKEKFEELQRRWIETKDKNILGEMYILLLDFYKNFITAYAKRKGIYFYAEELMERVTDCAGFTILHYLRREDFYIDNLTAYAWYDMRHELLKGKEEEQNTRSFEQLIEENDNEESIASILSKEIEDTEKENK